MFLSYINKVNDNTDNQTFKVSSLIPSKSADWNENV